MKTTTIATFGLALALMLTSACGGEEPFDLTTSTSQAISSPDDLCARLGTCEDSSDVPSGSADASDPTAGSEGATTDGSVAAEAITFTGELTRYVKVEAYFVRSLYLDEASVTANTPWSGTFEQADEPEVNYCGPTAGRNLLSWYGKDVSYATLGVDMRTNNWDQGGFAVKYCAAVTGINAPLFAICYKILTKELAAGTLPGDMKNALNTRKPTGFEVKMRTGSTDSFEIFNQLADGNPVMALIFTESGTLHWVVITGTYLDNGVLKLRVANGTDYTLSDFINKYWSLDKVGDAFIDGFLSSELGIKPYTMLYLEKTTSTSSTGLLGPSCSVVTDCSSTCDGIDSLPTWQAKVLTATCAQDWLCVAGTCIKKASQCTSDAQCPPESKCIQLSNESVKRCIAY